MKNLFLSLLLAFVVGDCIQLTSGVFKGQYWKIIKINKNGTYDITQKGQGGAPTWIIREVRGSYLRAADGGRCK